LFGDFNAHTAQLDDVALPAQQLLDDMGVMGGATAAAAVNLQGLPARQNQCQYPACEFGVQLVDLCTSTGSIILNGRAPGDQDGAVTRFSAHTSRASVVDYGIVSSGLYRYVTNFMVMGRLEVSDHAPLLCVFDLPAAQPAAQDGEPFGYQGAVSYIKWDPAKRQQYLDALASCREERERILGQIEGKLVSIDEGVQAWCQVVRDAAVGVFGVSKGGPSVRGDGRKANPWFKHCHTEWHALQVAVRQGNTHAAAAAHRVFNRAKRKFKRFYDRQWQARLLQDMKHNPRRFWTAFQDSKQGCAISDITRWEQHWKQLFGSGGQCSLPECGPSVEQVMARLLAERNVSSERVFAAEVLNAEISQSEVLAALRKLKSGRMAGPDGMKGELLKGAYAEFCFEDGGVMREYKLLPDLHKIYSAVFSSGMVPAVWCSAFLSAVFKKGDASLMDNYRGIAVGAVMGKLYSIILDNRLSNYCEEHGFRAKGQAGFRREKRTSDHVFVLKHLIDKHRLGRGSQPHLFVCFVDFRKAYDSVRRDLLMKCLVDMGLHGSMLSTIMHMYWHAPMVTKVGQHLGKSFDTTRGVKQGDPLSPLLFGVFIDRVESWLESRVPGSGAQLGQQLVKLLLYADDLALLASTAAELQSLLDALHEFCVAYDMEVNVAKTEIVVFGRKQFDKLENLQSRWKFAGQPIPVSSEFKYLGVVFHSTRGVSAAVSTLAAAGKRAMWAMLQRIGRLDIQSLKQKVDLFDMLVAPILSYCSEVWAPEVLGAAVRSDGMLDNVLQKVQFLFLRCVAGGVRKATPRKLLLREFGCVPVSRAWVRSMCELWNRMCAAGSGSLLYECLLENWDMRVDMSYGVKVWCQQFVKVLQHIGFDCDTLLQSEGLTQLDLDQVMSVFDSWFLRKWSDLPHDPRSASSEQVLYSVYDKWFAPQRMVALQGDDRYSSCPQHIQHTAGVNAAHLSSLLRFRLGAHDLPVATQRWRVDPGTRQRVARQNRTCQHCSSDLVGDEFHMVFECTFYAPVRVQFAQLFDRFGGLESLPHTVTAVGSHMSEFMGQDKRFVAAFVHSCWMRRCNSELVPVVHELTDSDIDVDSDELLQVELVEVLPD
jgi:hypothetical protein